MLLRIAFIKCSLLLSLFSLARTIKVKNQEELAMANTTAKSGDIILLQNGVWNNVVITLNCNGTKKMPVTFKAQTPGRVLITGNSKLKIGGSFIIVDGLYFTNGFSGAESVITFRINEDDLANNCRVTNTVINDFNNPKRTDENYWVSCYGKHNRIDHCSFLNKKNMGVLMAVILDNERSRENFHSIDHNYFGVRLPLASNSGEIIRVGVSQHCEFNSNTQITDNFFECCDGETEIISIKSCRNNIRNNLFKECQGSVVLRHGNYNTVENNIFLGNNKEGTGGVRVINKGQWVVNNLFYKCRGEWFRSPLSIMNGVPNSPANRYVAVTGAVIANNSFFECTPIGIGIGSDTERSVAPKDVQFLNNVFYNNSDSLIYNTYDDISGISFSGNLVNRAVKQKPVTGFQKTKLEAIKVSAISLPAAGPSSKNSVFDSLYNESTTRLSKNLSSLPGFAEGKLFTTIESNAKNDCGAKWFTKQKLIKTVKTKTVCCETPESVIELLKKNDGSKMSIHLTGKTYHFKEALFISQDVIFISKQKTPVKFIYNNPSFLIQVKAGSTLTLNNLNLDLEAVDDFITTDTSGSSNHSNFVITNSQFSNLNGIFFNAFKSSVSDSIIISNCTFIHSKGNLFYFANEINNKGYYNVENIKIINNKFLNGSGQILNMLRGGNDESTMGPYLVFSKNSIENYVSDNPLIHLLGTQRSLFEKNNFTNCNSGKTLIQIEDLVKAVHSLKNNRIIESGKVLTDRFVISDNTTQ
jgi:poly(beta-D-mannuronate) lyase